MNPVIFRCKRSGNTVSFHNEDDIAGLRKHEGYTEVIGNAETAKTIETESQEAASSTHEEVLKPRRTRRTKAQMLEQLCKE
jgi:hypothetical protein